MTPILFLNTHLNVTGTLHCTKCHRQVDVPKHCTAALQQKQGAKEAKSESCDTEAHSLVLGTLFVCWLHCFQTEVLACYHPASTQLQPDAHCSVTCNAAIAAKFELSKAERTPCGPLERHLGSQGLTTFLACPAQGVASSLSLAQIYPYAAPANTGHASWGAIPQGVNTPGWGMAAATLQQAQVIKYTAGCAP